MIAVIEGTTVINVGPWVYQLEDGTDNPLPEGAIEGEFDIVQNALGTFVLRSSFEELRRAEYPPIQEQLDALYDAGLFTEPMRSILKAIRDKYPSV